MISFGLPRSGLVLLSPVAPHQRRLGPVDLGAADVDYRGRLMPALDVFDQDHRLRWDASCRLLATVMIPEDRNRELRRQFTAHLRVEKANAQPGGAARLTKKDQVFASKFRARQRIAQIMQTRRVLAGLAGAMLWDLHTAVSSHPGLVSKSKIEFTIDRISIAQGKLGSLATLRDVWRRFRPVIHWCVAMAYQARVFGSPFPQSPETGIRAMS